VRYHSDDACGASGAILGASESGRRIGMLYYALVFFIIAIVAAVFGFGGIAAGAVSIAKVLFVIFLVLTVISLIANYTRRV
jgi:uncharacterized membrane protein YtjA (UPF0391 family)